MRPLVNKHGGEAVSILSNGKPVGAISQQSASPLQQPFGKSHVSPS